MGKVARKFQQKIRKIRRHKEINLVLHLKPKAFGEDYPRKNHGHPIDVYVRKYVIKFWKGIFRNIFFSF